MIKCEIDEKEFKNGGVLARYLKSKYSLTYREYYHKYILKSDEIPKCKCGCGIEMKWTIIGYREYIKGHYIRVYNPWGHNPKALAKSLKTRKRKFASGEITTWNNGLTKETDERVKNTGIGRSLAFTNEIKKQYSDVMRRNRLNGTVPTLYGPDASRWKGGISEINNIVRASKRLYDEWKFPILIRDGFKCVESGNNQKLHVHHNKEPMCEIVKKYITESGTIVDFDVKKSISDKIVDYHIKNDVSGVTLCSECHEKYHPSLNFG